MNKLLATTLILITVSAATFGQSDRKREILGVGSWNIEGIESGSAQNTRILAAQSIYIDFEAAATRHSGSESRRRRRRETKQPP